MVHGRAWTFLCDDAFISFRYADHLVELGSLRFNPTEAVEGYSNFAWVLLLAGARVLGLGAPPAVAPVLTVGCSLACLGLTVALTRQLRSTFRPPSRSATFPTPVDLLPAAWLVASPEFMVWSHGGLETSCATMLVLATLWAAGSGRWNAAGGLAAAAWLTRPDTSLPIVLAVATFWLTGALPVRRPERRWSSPATAILIVLAVVGSHFAWRLQVYGAWWPNTWFVKRHGDLLRPTYGRAYVEAWLQAVHAAVLIPWLVFVRRRHATLLLPVTAVVVYGYWVGGDFMAYGRFYLPATTLLAAATGWLFADAQAYLVARGRPRRAALLPGVGFALSLVLGWQAHTRWQLDRRAGDRWLDHRWEGVHAMRRFSSTGLEAGAWMREHLPPTTWITVGAAGAVPYASDLPAIDAFGLVDPNIVELPTAGPHRGPGVRPGHQFFAPAAYVRARDPDLLCHVGYRGTRRPGPGDAVAMFRRGYRWACIPVSSGWYCCRQPLDRDPGPFGTEGSS